MALLCYSRSITHRTTERGATVHARPLRLLIAVLLVASGVPLIATGIVAQGTSDAFDGVWERTDKPVADLTVSRTWMWGPAPFTPVIQEDYTEGPGGIRDVRYYDKARMEVTDLTADPASVWYVTNGLLVVELISGMMQVGHDDFEERSPAEVVVAGDLDDETGPTYATFAGLSFPGYTVPSGVGNAVTQRVARSGDVTDDPALAERGITLAYFDEITGHNIAGPFWEFMNSSGPVIENGQLVTAPLFLEAFYATGRPITEPYWAMVLVAGTAQDVLMQCFERRCLTYTPLNDPGWQVEAGNVGLHYHQWRYGDPPPPPPPVDAANPLINEVMFLPETGDPEWVELYNTADEAIEIGGMRLANGSLVNQVTLPAWTMPAGSYLVVYFGTGQNDNDFSDGSGRYFAGSAGLPFFSASDVALYGDAPSADTIIDFVAWGASGEYAPGSAHNHAVTAGTWSAGTFVDVAPPAPAENPWAIGVVLYPGDTIGRDRVSSDTNTPGDWDMFGGPDALEATPGAENYSEFLDEFDLLASSYELDQAPQLPLAAKSWTVMIYMDNRDPAVLRAMHRELLILRRTGSSANVNFVFQQFRLHGNLNSSFRGYLEGGTQHHLTREVGLNPGDPQVLSGFVTWARTNFPADRYAIILAGHGAGWKGLLVHRSQDDFLTMSELEAGLGGLGQNFDVVFFYACLMGQVEVGHQISTRADYMVASQQITWTNDGWLDAMTGLIANPAMPGSDLADLITNEVADAFDRFIANPRAHVATRQNMEAYTMASIDLSVLTSNLVPAIDGFSGLLRADIVDIREHDDPLDNGQIIIKRQRMATKSQSDTNYIDLRRFAELIGATDLAAANASPGVIQSVNDSVRVMRRHQGVLAVGSNGLSIYFPVTLAMPHEPSNPWEISFDTPLAGSNHGFANPFRDPRIAAPTRVTHLYKLDANILIPDLRGQPHPMEDDPLFRFPNSTGWDEFLHRYYKPVADACIRMPAGCVDAANIQVGETVTLSGNGSSDSDGPEGPMDDVPAHVGGHEHYYWDFHTSTDHPAPIPDYEEGVLYDVCTEDCDRDGIDDADDDPDAVGRLVQFTCTEPGVYPIRLMVWDEHHDKSRVQHEDQRHNDGRHWLHFNVDDAWVTVTCGDPPDKPVKKANKSTVATGEQIEYLIELPAAGEEALNVFFIDELPSTVVFVEFLLCDAGVCDYDPVAHMVTYEGVVEAEEIPEGIAYMVTVPEPPPPEEPPATPPPEITNCATGMVNDTPFESCVTIEFLEPSG